MVHLFVRHKVEDFEKWKKIFDEHGANRKSHGSKGARVYRNLNDTKEQFVITDWPSMDAAQNFVQDPNLKQVMDRAGVVGMPDIVFLEKADTQDA